jgi:acetyl esterase/lipase
MHRSAPATLLAAAIALFSTGCERALFAYVNRGTPPPAATAQYAADRDLSVDIYRPQGASGPAPTVVFFYGGAWKRGERAQYAFVGRRLAEAGMLALVPDYRTYPRATFPGFMEDAADAVTWARAHAAEHGGDPKRIFVMGHSAGAQIAALLGTDARYLKRVDMAPRDLAGVVGLSGPYDFVVGKTYAPIFGPPARWPDAQAVNFVSGDEPPFLLVHGTADRVVESVDSAHLDAKLRAAGVSSTLLWLEGGGHSAPLAGFYQDKRAPEVLPAVERFVSAK